MQRHDNAEVWVGFGEAADRGCDPCQAASPILPTVSGNQEVPRPRLDDGRNRRVFERNIKRGRVQKRVDPAVAGDIDTFVGDSFADEVLPVE